MKLAKVLKIFSFVCSVFLFFSPAFLISAVIASNGVISCTQVPIYRSIAYFFGVFTVSLVAFLTGMLTSKLRTKKSKYLKFANLLPFTVAILTFSLYFLIFFNLSISFFLSVILSITAFCLSYRKAFLPYDRIITFNSLFAGGAISIAVILCFTLSQTKYNSNCLIIPFFIAVAGYAITQNQASIDEMMNRRNHNMDSLPKKVRVYSFSFTAGVLFLIIIAVMLRKYFAKIVVLFFDVLKIALKGIYHFASFLTNLIFSGDTKNPNPLQEKAEEEFVITKYTISKAYMGYIIIAVVLIAAIIMMVRYRGEIANRLVSVYRKISAKIKAFFFNKTTSKDTNNNGGKYYFDETETVKGKSFSKPEEPLTFQKWKRKIKQYKKVKDETLKFRFGYSLILCWLKTRGADINTYETPLEIFDNCKKYFNEQELLTVTELYNKVRYCENYRPTNSDLVFLNNTLKVLTEQFK